MLNWEYNELLPFCDPGSEVEQGQAQASDQFMLFPALDLLQHGHQVKYSFLQWASCFIMYMAVMAANGHNIVNMYAYFNVILKASREFSGNMWAIYDVNYHQKQRPPTTRIGWLSTQLTLANASLGRHERSRAVRIVAHSSTKPPSALARKGNLQRAKRPKLPHLNRNQMCALTGITSICAT